MLASLPVGKPTNNEERNKDEFWTNTHNPNLLNISSSSFLSSASVNG